MNSLFEDSLDAINMKGDHCLEHREFYGVFSVVEFLHVDHAEISASRRAEP